MARMFNPESRNLTGGNVEEDAKAVILDNYVFHSWEHPVR